jgi:hypothetical protein
MAKKWKQPKCPLRDEWRRTFQYTHTIVFGHRKEGNTDTCYSVDEPKKMLSERNHTQKLQTE